MVNMGNDAKITKLFHTASSLIAGKYKASGGAFFAYFCKKLNFWLE